MANFANLLANVRETVSAGDVEACKQNVALVSEQAVINNWRMLASVAANLADDVAG